MERGPMALFGAIIAIGLGPAMWLGAQFGQVTLPERPPAVISEQQQLPAPRGGSGAGDAPTDAEAIRTEPKSNTEPLTRTKHGRSVVTKKPSPSPSASEEPSTPPVESESPKPPNSGGDESDPPKDPDDPPVDPPTEGDDEPDVPPQPPAETQKDPVAETTSEV